MEQLCDDIIGVLVGYMELDDLEEFVGLSDRIAKIAYKMYLETVVDIDDYDEGLYFSGISENIKFSATTEVFFEFLNGESSLLTKFAHLELCCDKGLILDKDIQNLTSLVELDIEENEILTDNGIKQLVNLKSLNMANTENITDDGIKNLKNLIELDISGITSITDEGVKNLVNLEKLLTNSNITNIGLKKMINLKKLYIFSAAGITNEGITHLKKLETLWLSYNDVITFDTVCSFKHLKTLNIQRDNKIFTSENIIFLEQKGILVRITP